eukprot:gene11353-4521_t
MIEIKHSSNTVLMISPFSFCFNKQTSESNEFQHKTSKDKETLTKLAQEEYTESVKRLENEGVNVISLGDPKDPQIENQPDAVFCNNWISTTPYGSVVIYPMETDNRKSETKRINEVLEKFEEQNLEVKQIFDFSHDKESLEGTGSMVIDYINRVIYATLSVRTSPKQLQKLMENVTFYKEFELCFFTSKTSSGEYFYHTNVMMSLGTDFGVICKECIIEEDRDRVMNKLKQSGKEIIEISIEQTEKHFCGNILEVIGSNGHVITMSDNAKSGFNKTQLSVLEKHGKIVEFPISKTIEFVGGGSARCMVAQVFLPKKEE